MATVPKQCLFNYRLYTAFLDLLRAVYHPDFIVVQKLPACPGSTARFLNKPVPPDIIDTNGFLFPAQNCVITGIGFAHCKLRLVFPQQAGMGNLWLDWSYQ
jgi:hypothetical protein